jgi:hypothetical protein
MKRFHYILSFVIICGALFARYSDKYSSLSKKDVERANGAIQHELLPSEIEDNDSVKWKRRHKRRKKARRPKRGR